MAQPIYLDHNATTPVAEAVIEAFRPYLRERYINPSASHPAGDEVRRALTTARAQVATLLGTEPGSAEQEIIFTGCATEANNLAIRGAALACRERGRHLITSAVEHPSVAAPIRQLEREGWSVTVLPVDGSGRVAPDALAARLRPDTTLVTVMHANNEVGTIQPIPELARIARAHSALFHTDAAQSAGKIAMAEVAREVDLLTVAGHKLQAPKGVGALYVRGGTLLEPMLLGGGQERGIRSGTENVPWIVALGAACARAQDGREAIRQHMKTLRDELHRQLAEAIPELALNGHPAHRLPNTLNVSFPGVLGQALLLQVQAEVVAATGSACHGAGRGGVLDAMGLGAERGGGAVRLSVGAETTESEVARAAEALIAGYREVKQATV